ASHVRTASFTVGPANGEAAIAINRFAASRAVIAAALLPRPPLDLSPLSASCRSYWTTVATGIPREIAIASTSCPGVAIFDSPPICVARKWGLVKVPFAFYANVFGNLDRCPPENAHTNGAQALGEIKPLSL